MACSCSHPVGCSSHLHHSVVELLLLHPAGCELEGSEEEDGTLPYFMERKKRLHASDKVCPGQRELLKVGPKKKRKAGTDVSFILKCLYQKAFNEGIQDEETFEIS